MAEHIAAPSYRRTARTVYAIVVALLTFIPAFVALVMTVLPEHLSWTATFAALGGAAVAGVAVTNQVINTLESFHLIPAWLREGETLTLKDSTRRALRTLYQGVTSLIATGLVIIPAVMPLLPHNPTNGDQLGVILPSVLVGLTIVTRVITGMEDRGLLPAFLRNDIPAKDPSLPAPDAQPDPPIGISGITR